MYNLDSDAFELKRMMRQEAHEKCFEIQVQGQRLFEAEKDKIVKEGIEYLDSKHENKLNNLKMSLNINKSKRVNETRVHRMKARNACIEKIKQTAKQHLIDNVAVVERIGWLVVHIQETLLCSCNIPLPDPILQGFLAVLQRFEPKVR